MKANELRIGNYLQADIGIVKVESILGSTFRAYCHSVDEEYLADYSLADLKPIPLISKTVDAEFEVISNNENPTHLLPPTIKPV